MKTKVLIVMSLVTLVFVACNKQTSQSEIEKVFVDYVNTDFGNPDDFVEITKVEKPDTFAYASLKEGLDACEKIKPILPLENQRELESLQARLGNNESYYFVKTELKARLKQNGNYIVKSYYVIYENGNYKVVSNLDEIDGLAWEIIRLVLKVNLFLDGIDV